MRILVTGGAGFIGSWVVRRLMRRHRLTVFDDLSSGRESNVPEGVRLIQGDVRDKKAVDKALRGSEAKVVTHLAAQVNLRTSLVDPTQDASVNILGSLNVLEACAKRGVRRFIFASSGGAVYGEPKRLPCRESDPTHPLSPYGIAKLAVERLAGHYQRSAGLEVVNLRLGNVYGPGQRPEGECGLVAIALDRLAREERLRIFGDGRQTRDYVFVEDVARAFECALRAPSGTYNVGTGREISVNDVLRLLGGLSGRELATDQGGANPGEVGRNALDGRLAAGSLKWGAKVSLEKGLSITIRQAMELPTLEPACNSSCKHRMNWFDRPSRQGYPETAQ